MQKITLNIFLIKVVSIVLAEYSFSFVLNCLRKRLPNAIIRKLNYKKCVEKSPSIATNMMLYRTILYIRHKGSNNKQSPKHFCDVISHKIETVFFPNDARTFFLSHCIL